MDPHTKEGVGNGKVGESKRLDPGATHLEIARRRSRSVPMLVNKLLWADRKHKKATCEKLTLAANIDNH